MGLVLLVILVALPLGALLGERGGRILGHRLNSPWLLIAAFAAQLAEPLSDHRISYPTLMLVSAVLMIQFALRNRRVAGIPLAALGLLLNTVVVVGNGAMPVEEHAVVRAGLPAQTLAAASDARHEPADAQTKLRALSDRIAVPIPGHREIDSLGDLALAAGAGLFSFELTYRRRRVFDPTLSLRLLRA